MDVMFKKIEQRFFDPPKKKQQGFYPAELQLACAAINHVGAKD
jgi:hypothetical protein